MACFWTDLIGVRESCDGGGGGGLPVDALIPLNDYFENAVWAASPLFEPAPYTYPPVLVLSPTTIGMVNGTSACANKLSLNPAPSLPISHAVGRLKSC